MQDNFVYDEVKVQEIKTKLTTDKLKMGLIKGVIPQVLSVKSQDIDEVYFELNKQKERLFNIKDANQIYYNIRIGERECQYYGEIEYQIIK